MTRSRAGPFVAGAPLPIASSVMVMLARTFFWVHTGLCLAYLAFAGRALGVSVAGAARVLPRSLRVGDLLVVHDERAVNAMLYVVLGLFLLYAEIYMYRVYLLTTTLLA